MKKGINQLCFSPSLSIEEILDLGKGADFSGVELSVGEEGLTDGASASFVLPLSCPEELLPILYVLPLQMLAHDLSCMRGLNPDAPRGLSKVTETW
jgi:glucosamine--fructose-6-phosphate aminotransferase (isomerizing)